MAQGPARRSRYPDPLRGGEVMEIFCCRFCPLLSLPLLLLSPLPVPLRAFPRRGEGNGHGENGLLARVPFGLFRRSQELRASASISRMDERHVGWLFEPEGERNHGFVEQLFVRNISEEEEAGVGCEACKIGDNRRNDFFFLSEENSSNDFLQNRAFIYHLFPCTRTRVENRRGETRVLSSSGRN